MTTNIATVVREESQWQGDILIRVDKKYYKGQFVEIQNLYTNDQFKSKRCVYEEFKQIRPENYTLTIEKYKNTGKTNAFGVTIWELEGVLNL